MDRPERVLPATTRADAVPGKGFQSFPEVSHSTLWHGAARTLNNEISVHFATAISVGTDYS
jgi:hypothetical protein